MDAIVYFNPLGAEAIQQVVHKLLIELENQLLTKSVEIDFDPEVRDWLAAKGYDRDMGARPMARLIQDEIKKPLANEILFGQLENGGHVQIQISGKTAADQKPKFKFKPSKPKVPETVSVEEQG